MSLSGEMISIGKWGDVQNLIESLEKSDGKDFEVKPVINKFKKRENNSNKYNNKNNNKNMNKNSQNNVKNNNKKVNNNNNKNLNNSLKITENKKELILKKKLILPQTNNNSTKQQITTTKLPPKQTISLFDYIQIQTSKKVLQNNNKINKLTQKNNTKNLKKFLQRNPNECSNVKYILLRGKERINPKPKKHSKLKKLIIKERLEYLNLLMNNINNINNNDNNNENINNNLNLLQNYINNNTKKLLIENNNQEKDNNNNNEISEDNDEKNNELENVKKPPKVPNPLPVREYLFHLLFLILYYLNLSLLFIIFIILLFALLIIIL